MDKKKIENLKSNIYRQLEQIQDVTVLQMLQEATESYASANTKDILDALSPQQFVRLQESIQQADRGEMIADEIVKANARKWLSK
jgi:hypothetical protein